MENTYTIKMFLKFGSEKDMNELYRKGIIYMNPIQRFREIEDNELRGDIYEGVSKVVNILPGKFEIPTIGFKGNHLGVHLRESYQEVLGNIYSLYCVSSHGWLDPNEFSIDEKINNFGTHCLMIKDNQVFLKLLEEQLIREGYKFEHGFVEYYNKELVNREIDLFEKPLEFEYQKEFRLYVERNGTDPIMLSVGSLESISELHLTESVINTLKMGN